MTVLLQEKHYTVASLQTSEGAKIAEDDSTRFESTSESKEIDQL